MLTRHNWNKHKLFRSRSQMHLFVQLIKSFLLEQQKMRMLKSFAILMQIHQQSKADHSHDISLVKGGKSNLKSYFLPFTNRKFRWKFNNSGEVLYLDSERYSKNGTRSILHYTPVTEQVRIMTDKRHSTYILHSSMFHSSVRILVRFLAGQ